MNSIPLYTIGYTKKNAEIFFNTLKINNIKRILDIRLNNVSQLAAFTKHKDLKFFLKEILNCDYFYLPEFAPSKELLKNYKNKNIIWKDYEEQYNFELMKKEYNKIYELVSLGNSCLLCSEFEPSQCHRRLLAEHLHSQNDMIKIVHL